MAAELAFLLGNLSILYARLVMMSGYTRTLASSYTRAPCQESSQCLASLNGPDQSSAGMYLAAHLLCMHFLPEHEDFACLP